MVTVKAASIKNLDRARASGSHYSTENEVHQPKIIGSDGTGYLEDGSKVYFFSKKGTVAEKAVADKTMMVPIPEALDFSIAAALPNAVMGSAMALKYKAGIQPGNTVLINGATGITGRIAVQIAQLYGAQRIIVTGRNEESRGFSLHWEQMKRFHCSSMTKNSDRKLKISILKRPLILFWIISGDLLWK